MASVQSMELWDKLKKESNDKEAIQKSFVNHVYSTFARTPYNLDNEGAYQAAAHSVRDRLIREWIATQENFRTIEPKRVYYMSLEYLIGRSFQNTLMNMGLAEKYGDALKEFGFKLEDMYDVEVDAALGNGGLGRLAACFMESLATLDYPACGYGIRYTYGIFEQRIHDGEQFEYPDYWLNFENPWEVPRKDIMYPVRFYGHVEGPHPSPNKEGKTDCLWDGGEIIQAMAYDVPVAGYGTKNVIYNRLWCAKPSKDFDFHQFNQGNYEQSVAERERAEHITSVLYPNDSTPAGKELRLRQQYFFVSASLQDILRRFKRLNKPHKEIPDYVSIQLNDTHPTLGIVELQRVLVDEEGLTWDDAWDIVTRTFSYTNHTVLPEALETWTVDLLNHVLPRHMQIIFAINLFFLQKIEKRFPNDRSKLRTMSIIDEGHTQRVRMSFLAVVGSHTVNGVAAIHSDIVREDLFKEFVEFYGAEKFQNKTNGVTPRRWLNQANPELTTLIAQKLGNKDFLKDLNQLKELNKFADDKEFQEKWMAVKLEKKKQLAAYIQKILDLEVDPNALFDVQVKRMHEYKRQYLNILGVIDRYLKIKKAVAKNESLDKFQKRVVIFGGKAAPGYYIAKLIIKLINGVGSVVNSDQDIKDLLKVVFIPNYNVSSAEMIMPASDISQHVSTAGFEASGTGNMKFVLNGGIILGTLDGANVEIKEEVGDDNIFIFGAKAHEVDSIRQKVRFGQINVENKDLNAVVAEIRKGTFGDAGSYNPLLERLNPHQDFYLVCYDFPDYLKSQELIDAEYKKTSSWAKKSIHCTANMGKFSSDRTIKEYAEQIWNIKPVKNEAKN